MNIDLVSYNRTFFKFPRCFQPTHRCIRFFDTAEIAHTTKPARGSKCSIDRQFRKKLLHPRAYLIGIVLSLPRIIPGISLNITFCSSVAERSFPIKAPIRGS